MRTATLRPLLGERTSTGNTQIEMVSFSDARRAANGGFLRPVTPVEAGVLA